VKTMRITADSTRKMNITPLRPNLLLKERALAREQAARLLATAEERAGVIIAGASQEAERLREEARERGYREVAAKVAEAATIQNRLASRCLTEIAGLAAEMARRILSRELRNSPQDVARICARVIRENRCGRKLRVYVHPEDLEFLRDGRHPLLADPDATVAFLPSSRVDRGGCLVRGEQGQVDGRLGVQLEELSKAMREE
jgi:flagellar biosynthesis/type III secretory pathway protein FliH